MCKYQIIRHYGRTGNNILHILSLLFYVEKDTICKYEFAPHKLFVLKDIPVKGCMCSNVKIFNHQILLCLSVHKLRELYQKYLQTTMRPVSQRYDIGIHIRSGDIFQGKGHRLYAQPPLYFYEKIMNENQGKSIVFVYENLNNPVISVLIEKYKSDANISFQSKSLEEDIMTLSQCRVLACSVGTFCLVPFVISKSIDKLLIPDYFEKNQWFTFDNVETEIIDLPGYYETEWANTKDQCNKILNYKN